MKKSDNKIFNCFNSNLIRIYKNIIAIIGVFTLVFFSVKCVETNVNGPGGDGTTGTYEITLNVSYPLNGDSLRMGKNNIIYQALEASGGAGLAGFDLFVGLPGQVAVNLQSFPVVTDGINPEIYIHTDTIETKLGINPSNFPSRISYWLTAYSKSSGVEAKAIKIQDSIFVDRRPETPASLILVRITNTSFNLSWSDLSSNETKYELWRKDGNNAGFLKINELPANSISINDFVSSAFITYYYKLRAVNGFGSSSFSNEVNSSGIAGGGQPTNLKAEALGATKVKLTWIDNSNDELGFIVQRTNPLNGQWEEIARLTSNNTEYFDNTVKGGTAYSYRVASYTSTSFSAWSNTATITTFTQDVSPPLNLTAKYLSSEDAVLIQWIDNTNQETGTLIERKDGLTGQFKEIGSQNTDFTSYIDTNIVPNTTYTYRARHSTMSGFRTDYSDTAQVYVPLLPPKAPSDLRITEFETNKVYGLVWSDNSNNEDGFELLRTESVTNVMKILKFPANARAHNDTIPDPSKTYYYKIRSYKGTLYSDYSNQVDTKGGGTKLSAPTNLSAAQASGQIAVNLTWSYNSTNNLGFVVERKSVSDLVYTEIARVSPNARTYLDNTNLQVGNTYVYRIKAYNSTEESVYSNLSQTITVTAP
ncbi:MAG: hypothetical protein CVV23_06345 [Ignavibacteriae bacterium HGW-Ignavibacteriae-2]|nr:MAG: hypothetical protein CVV23_06345 [Ignavibacteriae bacterium HGW-Ignavibacteriae-2]